jgi:2-polyprenyl-3-methyl-5-hydroxy-6-metoxy-1,4-benzoquinol methylase
VSLDDLPDGPPSRKPGAYYSQDRADLVAELPRPLGAVLDVGCGEGGVATGLRAAGATMLTGIELDPQAARLAEARYDEIIVGDAEVVIASVAGPFDTILCYDVLEHLRDPEAVLKRLHRVAGDRARLHVSVPNARHHSLLADLVFRGTFGYTEWGHRDTTHLRWFTRRDIVSLLESCGWSAQRVSHPVLSRPSNVLDRLTRGRSTEFIVGQWYVLASAQQA